MSLVNVEQFENFRKVYQDRWKQARCFHILGFDILIDEELKPWILEVNASPSLEITQEKYNMHGHKVGYRIAMVVRRQSRRSWTCT